MDLLAGTALNLHSAVRILPDPREGMQKTCPSGETEFEPATARPPALEVGYR
jgi:hypothetical protein